MGGGVFFAEGGLFAGDQVLQSAPIAEVIGVLAVLEQKAARDTKEQEFDALEGGELDVALEDKVVHLFFALFEEVQAFKEHRAHPQIPKEGLFELVCSVGIGGERALKACPLSAS